MLPKFIKIGITRIFHEDYQNITERLLEMDILVLYNAIIIFLWKVNSMDLCGKHMDTQVLMKNVYGCPVGKLPIKNGQHVN